MFSSNITSLLTTKKSKPQPNSNIKIRLYLSPEQKVFFNKIAGVRRFIYNNVLSYLKTQPKIPPIKVLRAQFVNDGAYKNTENEWMLEYEYDIRDEALRDILKNYKSNIAKGEKFKLRYKKKVNDKKHCSMSVMNKKWNKTNNYYAPLFNIKNLKTSDPLPETLEYTSRLIRHNDKFYLSIPRYIANEKDTKKENKICSIDPGQKTFATIYDPEGKVILYGKKDIGLIGRLLSEKHKLQSKVDKASNRKKRHNYKRALMRISDRIEHLVKDLHNKLAKFLCENYNAILISKLNFHTMKKLTKRNKNKLKSYRHCEFVDLLINKAKTYKDCKVLVVNEAFTSKTCCNCGHIHEKLGNNSEFICPNCNLEILRDANGAIGIFLRYFTKRVKLNLLEESST